MPTVKLPRGDWDTVTTVLQMAIDAGLVAYIEGVIDDITNQVDSQEY